MMTPFAEWHRKRKKEIEARLSMVAFFIMCMTSAVIFGASWREDIKATEVETVDEKIGADNLLIIEEVATEYGICPELVEALVWYESSGRADVVSDGGCVGLMQINPRSQSGRMKELGVTDLKDPESNIRVGCDYLTELFEKYEDVAVVLAAYNTGEYSNATSNAINGTVGPYAQKVLIRAEELERAHGK